MLELFLALSTAQISVAALCVGLSALAWAHSLLLLVSLGTSALSFLFWDFSQQGRHGYGLSVRELFAREVF